MTADELNSVMLEWKINAAQFANVLCLHTNKMSEYPEALNAYHVQLNLVSMH